MEIFLEAGVFYRSEAASLLLGETKMSVLREEASLEHRQGVDIQ